MLGFESNAHVPLITVVFVTLETVVPIPAEVFALMWTTYGVDGCKSLNRYTPVEPLTVTFVPFVIRSTYPLITPFGSAGGFQLTLKYLP